MPEITSTSETVDDHFRSTRNQDDFWTLPSDLFDFCQIKNPTPQQNQQCQKQLVGNFDHSHFGLAIESFGTKGVLVSSPHRYRTELKGGVSFYRVKGTSLTPFEEWYLDSTNIENGGRMGELFGWSLATGNVFGMNELLLTLIRPIGLPPHTPVAQKIADQC